MEYCVYTVLGSSAFCEGYGFLSTIDLREVMHASDSIFVTHNRETLGTQKSVNIHYLIKLLGVGVDIGSVKLTSRNSMLVQLFESGIRAHVHAGIPIQNYKVDELFPQHTVESYLQARTALTRDILDKAILLSFFDEHLAFYNEMIIPLDSVLIEMAKQPVSTTTGAEKIEMSPASTRLGRLSVVRGTNILNIRKPERSKFVSRFDEGELVHYDFKAIDFRIALFDAGYSKVAMVEDLYTQIKEMTGLPMRRDNIKVLALGRLYGMAMSTASKKFGVPQSRVEEYITMFSAAFPGIATRRRELENEFVDNEGVVFNWFGRPVHVDKQRNAYQNYIASNTADICSLAYRAVYENLIQDTERKVVMFLHDAIIVDQAPNTERGDIAQIMRNILPDLGKFHVSITSGKNLMEATS